jgi:hypothetical protein
VPFQLGILTLLSLLVIAPPAPAAGLVALTVLLGFATIAATLDLLPLTSILVGAGLVPLAIPASRRSRLS